MTLQEGINLSSIIEKEAVLDEDRALISSVFYNRLDIGMPLQSDATIQYIFDERKQIVTYADLKIDSPYNTYLNKGLPPTPIANPGIKSIKAALYPEKTDNIYIVAKIDGGNNKSTNYEDHIKYEKENKDARNLLGLVYFESGEVVSALTEWVISNNMNPDDNLAEYYIDKLQSNKNKLDTINQTIRKYNQALVYCREDHDDMAMIQLKKVLSQNPKLIKAYHLLALLYLKHQDYEKARKLLKKAAFIDTNNTTTLRYLQEVELATGISTSLDVKRKKKYAKEKVDRLSGTVTYMNGNEMIIQPTTFRDSSAVATFINFFLGIVLGAAVVWFLVVPSTRQSIYEKANAQVTDANSQMAAQVSRVQGLQEENDGYQRKVEAANNAKEEANTEN